jgi:hypothetical protein
MKRIGAVQRGCDPSELRGAHAGPDMECRSSSATSRSEPHYHRRRHGAEYAGPARLVVQLRVVRRLVHGWPLRLRRSSGAAC